MSDYLTFEGAVLPACMNLLVVRCPGFGFEKEMRIVLRGRV